MKGFAEFVGFVIITLLVVVSIAIVLMVGIPLIEEAIERGVVNEAEINMRIVDDAVRGVASQGTGTLKSLRLSVTDGLYRVNPGSESFDFEMRIRSEALSRGTFTREGNLYIFFVGSASAKENTTHIILENEVMEVVQPKIGSETSFAGINTSSAISTMTLKDSNAVIAPFDARIIVASITNTSWGLGYSKAAFQGSNLGEAESVFHVRSNYTGVEYEVVYTLPASSDFVTISVRNVSRDNATTLVMSYRLGASITNDIVRVGNVNETTFFTVDTTTGTNFTSNVQSTQSLKGAGYKILNVNATDIFYNSSDNTNRSVSELYGIGQGNWFSTNNGTHTNVTFELAGTDGWDYGIRDALVGGSYWLDENGTSLESGLVGYWKLSEGGGTYVADSSGYENTGSWTGGSNWTSAKFGFGGAFNSSASYVSAPASSKFAYTTNSSTISTWLKLDAKSDTGYTVLSGLSDGTTHRLAIIYGAGSPVTSPQIYLQLKLENGTTVTTNDAGITISTNTGWRHVAGVWDGSTLKFYIDNVLRKTVTIGGSTARTSSDSLPFSIGRAINSGPENIIVDDVRFYERALSSDEVKKLYESSSIKIQSDFLGMNSNPYLQMNLTNHTGGTIFTQPLEAIKVNDRPITSNYSVNDTSVYFFDWKDNDWKIWQRNDYANALVGWWKLDEGQGTSTSDSAGNSNTGTLINSPTWITNSSCKLGTCLSFDGSNDHVAIQSSSLLQFGTSTDLTMSTWIKTSYSGSAQQILFKGDQAAGHYWMRVDSDGKVTAEVADTSLDDSIATTRSTVNDGRWHHILARADRDGRLIVFVDGVQDGAGDTMPGIDNIDNGNPLIIGARNNSGTVQLYFNGMIDDTRIWNRTLTLEEIKAEYQNSKRGMPDWLDPRFKESFKWRQEFRKIGMPSINITYSMTAHDPFIRTFVDTGPIGYTSVVDPVNTSAIWQFNEGSGTATRDETSKGNTGTITGASWNASGKFGYGLSFDGVDDQVNAGSGSSIDNILTGGGTVTAWINPNSGGEGGAGRIISKGDNVWAFWVEDESGGSVRLGFNHGRSGATGDWRTSTRAVPINTLTHVAVVYNSDSASNDPLFYVNGILVSTLEDNTPTGTASDDSSENFIIGNRPNADTTFNGVIDEVTAWNRILTAEEISEEHQRGANHTISIPVDLGSPKAKSAHFDSGNGNYHSTVGGNWYVHSFNNSGWYGLESSGTWTFLGSTSLEKPIVAFPGTNVNDPVLWYTTAWKAGPNKHKDYDLRWENTSLVNYGRIASRYSFNSTSNSNFMFSLGYSPNRDTSGWGGGATCINFCSTHTGFSNESIESMANSTLTYYDLKDRSLVGWWKFDDSNILVKDYSGNNNTGTLYNTPTFVSNSSCKGNFGGCMGFNGTSSRMNATDSPLLKPEKITFMGWFKTSSTARGNVLTKRFNPDDQSSYGLETNIVGIGADGGTGKVTAYIHDGSVAHYAGSESSSLNDGNWHHAAGTYDGNDVILFIDGVRQAASGTSYQASKPIYYPTTPALQPLIVGNGTQGLVDNVKIYSRVLSDDEIKADYLVTADGYPNFGKTSQTNGATSIPAASFNYDGGAASIWQFNEGSGLNVTDSSTNLNAGLLGNGSTSSQPFWINNASCRFGNCLSFNGSQVVTIPDSTSLDITSKITVEVWMNPDSTSGESNIVHKGTGCDGYTLWYRGTVNQKVYFIKQCDGSSNTPTTTALQSGNWYHVVGTYDGYSFRIYLNGKLEAVNTYSMSFGDVGNLLIGNGQDGYFRGKIDEVRIYPRALTNSEIIERYQSSVSKYYDDFGTAANGRTYRYIGVEDANTTLQPITPNGTVLHFRFNDNSTINVTDVSGFANNGRQVNNAAWITNSSCKTNFGGCMNFHNTSSQYVTVLDSPSVSVRNQVTYSAWVKKTTGSGQLQSIISKSDNQACGSSGPALFVLTSDFADFEVDVNDNCLGATGSTPLSDGRWHMVTGTYDGSNARIYVDGVLEGTSSTSTGTMADRSHNVLIGANLVTGSLVRYFNGQIDEVLIINRSLTANEIYELYLGGMNRTVNGRWHRVASMDDLNSASLNLTDHNNTLTIQGYDMRVIFANGTFRNVTNTPNAGCYTPSQLADYYMCSQDSSEFSSPKTAGMIFSGKSHLLQQVCNDVQGSFYKFNVTTLGPSRTIVPFTNGVCNDIGNKTDIIEREQIPSTVFGDVTLSGEKTIFMSLLYRDIKLRGDARMGKGDNRICVEKTGKEGERILVNITSC